MESFNFGFCPRCIEEVIAGAYACALCGYAFPTRRSRAPDRWIIAFGASLGFALGCSLGLRWGGYGAIVAAPVAGFVGMLLGLLPGALLALMGPRSRSVGGWRVGTRPPGMDRARKGPEKQKTSTCAV
jgi:hypothetical protein